MSKKNLLHLMTIMMVAMLSVGFTSCGSDDDEENSSYSIVGLWEETAYWKDGQWKSSSVLNYVFDFKKDNTYILYLDARNYKEGKTYQTGTYTFDGNYIALDGDFKHKVTFSENGQSMRIEECFTFRKYNGN
ncbi:MAG: hypothetical protein IKT00_01910 [Prevotella sp.]|nr:hypothetical protein [Prevotella sp.]